jgi:cephalosporin-C deacetylase-like acetyl esterase
VRISQLFLLTILLSSGILKARAQNELSTLNSKVDLDYRETLFQERDDVKIFEASYAGIEGGRIELYLILPPGKGKFAGVIFQPGSEQNKFTYLAEGILLAKAGALSLITDIQFPETDPLKLEQFRKDYIIMFYNMRRAVDLLVAREDVDIGRIGYVGHSHGAMIGSALSGIDKRISAFVLLGGLSRLTEHMRTSALWQSFRDSMTKPKFEEFLARMKSLDPVEFIGKSAPAPVLFQCANFDEIVPKDACQSLYQAGADPKQLKWYDSKHDFQDFDAAFDQLKWMQQHLRLKALGPIFQKKLSDK